jgi:hypothetical protein
MLASSQPVFVMPRWDIARLLVVVILSSLDSGLSSHISRLFECRGAIHSRSRPGMLVAHSTAVIRLAIVDCDIVSFIE